MVKVLNCPFCQSSGTLVHDPLWHDSHGYPGCYEVYVQCTNEKCKVILPFGKYHTIYIKLADAERQAIDKWNDRGESNGF